MLAVTPDDRARRLFDIARAEDLVAEGYALAQAGDLEGVADTYSRALTFDPLLKIESYQEPEARRMAWRLCSRAPN